jgi:hypothetical protein
MRHPRFFRCKLQAAMIGEQIFWHIISFQPNGSVRGMFIVTNPYKLATKLPEVTG